MSPEDELKFLDLVERNKLHGRHTIWPKMHRAPEPAPVKQSEQHHYTLDHPELYAPNPFVSGLKTIGMASVFVVGLCLPPPFNWMVCAYSIMGGDNDRR